MAYFDAVQANYLWCGMHHIATFGRSPALLPNRASSNTEGVAIVVTKGFIEDARKSFRLASTAQAEHEMERYALMGCDYIKLAHDAGKLKDPKELPRLWRTH